MATNQEGKHTAFRLISGTESSYEEDSLSAFIISGSTGTTYDELFISWLQFRTGSDKTNIQDLKALFAIQLGFANWDNVNDFGISWNNLNTNWEDINENWEDV